MTNQTKLVPKRRFKEFQNTYVWEQRKLNVISDVRDGTHDSPQYVLDGHPFITSKNVKDGYINYDDVQYISDDDFMEINKRSKVDKNDILMGMIGTIGNIALVREKPDFAIKNVALIKDTGSIYYLYLYHYLQSNNVLNQLSESMDGGTQKFIALNKIRELMIAVPSKDEQYEIGNYLEALDHLITLHQRKLEKTKALKLAYLSEMFPTEGKCEPKKRFTGFTQAWETCKLGEVVENLYNGQTPSRFNDSFWNGNINWLSSGELNRETVYKTSEKITPLGQKDANLRIVPKGTFVMAITGLEAAGTRGNCGILGVDTTINQSCMAIYPKKEKLDTQFLFQWYKMVGDDYGTRFTQGTKQQSYNAEIIKNLEITLPTIEEQKAIGGFFSSLDNLITLHHHKLKKLQNVKKAYLNEMFV